MAEAFFLPDNGLFESTPLTRGPWSPDFQHGGPPAALMARAIERRLNQADSPFQIARFNLLLLRAVPIAPLRSSAQVERDGRKLKILSAELRREDGELLCKAEAVCIRSAQLDLPETPDYGVAAPPPPQDSRAFDFPFFTGDVGYHTAMEVRFARGKLGDGDVAAWMRMRYPLVPDETPSPLQRVLIAADSGNGVSMMMDPKEYLFINPDLNVALQRYPDGEWVCLEAATRINAKGIGLADTRLWDESGIIGRSNQILLVDKQAR